MIYFLLVFYIIFGFSFFIWGILYVLPFFFGAPFVKSSEKRTQIMMELLDPKKGDVIADLGSGDGRLLFEIAKRGATAYGFEVNPFLIWRTKRRARTLGLSNKVFVRRSNFFNEDLSQFDALTIYGISYIMPRLGKKLKRELKPGTRVVSNYFSFPNWKPIKKEDDVSLYRS